MDENIGTPMRAEVEEMDTKMIIELVGYFGSLLVVVSMLMTSVMKLRIINTIGSTIFAGYALVIHSYPTAVMNIALIIINVVNMRKLAASSDSYDIVKAEATDAFAIGFVRKYADDIKKFFPDFKGITDENRIFIMTNGDTVAGITAGSEKPDGVFDISIDYTTPAYRDCSVGHSLYSKLKGFGLKEAVFSRNCVGHDEYLKNMGFVGNNGRFVKRL